MIEIIMIDLLTEGQPLSTLLVAFLCNFTIVSCRCVNQGNGCFIWLDTMRTHTHTHTHTHTTHSTHMYTPIDAVGLLWKGAVLLGIGGAGATHDHHGDTDTDLLRIHHIDMILISREARWMYGWADDI